MTPPGRVRISIDGEFIEQAGHPTCTVPRFPRNPAAQVSTGATSGHVGAPGPRSGRTGAGYRRRRGA